MYYSSGNYEAFAHPKKPEGVDHKSAYIIGTGLAALSSACYLVRDGQMKGEHIHIFEKDPIPGGACDGFEYPGTGYVMRGGREMDNHFEVMWDLFRSIPSIETEGVSVLDEYYWLNKEDPNYSLCRATVNRGQDAHTDKKFAVSDKAQMEIMKLFFTPDEELYDKRIDEYFDDEVFDSNFWLYWRTMFAFENWHSALEMKRYIKRYIHHIGGLPDFTALRFTQYNLTQKILLEQKRNRLNGIIELITDVMKGVNTMSFEAFSNEDVQKIVNHTLECMSKESIDEQVKKFGSLEKYKEYLSSGFKNEQAMADLMKWYGSKEKAMGAMMQSTGDTEEIKQEQDENAKIYRQFMSAKESDNMDMERSAVELLAKNYKKMFALDNARNIFLDLAKEYLQNSKLTEVTDSQFGIGCSEYVANAIKRYYGV